MGRVSVGGGSKELLGSEGGRHLVREEGISKGGGGVREEGMSGRGRWE